MYVHKQHIAFVPTFKLYMNGIILYVTFGDLLLFLLNTFFEIYL